MAHHVFICYVPTDIRAADMICGALENSGIRCWMAPRDVPPGVEPAAAIRQAIEKSRVMVLLFSRDANHSDEINRQAAQAKYDDVVPLVVRLENSILNEALRHDTKRATWMDALTAPLEAHLPQVVVQTRKLLDENPGKVEEPEAAQLDAFAIAPAPAHAAAPETEFDFVRDPVPPRSVVRGATSTREIKPQPTQRSTGRVVLLLLVFALLFAGWRAFLILHHPARRVPFVNSIGMQFLRIEPGRFLMGSPDDESGRTKNETQHRVRLTHPFMMQTTTVTQKQWREIMGANPAGLGTGADDSMGDDLPVVEVSWDDAVEFCRRLSAKEGRKYRLPTEAEWEYACRAGTETPYNFGDKGDLADYAWFDANSDHRTHPVAHKLPNAWGLYDMHGNVWQWCSDYFAPYSADDQTDPTGPARGDARVLRGGSWSYDRSACRSAYRYSGPPGKGYFNIGFRCVLEVQ